ncbi:YcnI family copper-binding membrane protein [Mycolicibacterium mengxianglii]|uniref:YcnI family copper-binding membrane protein n=1 Tax=Mycolicibacterium mengxianglii TaxID=2736649 RepID=UPI0018EF3316|nr:YcnI family protein [Mycolicibacterium mengxianglii]
MTDLSRSTLRILCSATVLGACSVGAWTAIAPASAHVHVDADDPVRAGTTVITFRVPNESGSGSPTTALTVDLPDVASARTDVMEGWSAQLDKDPATGAVRSVTWTADPDGGIPSDQFELFHMQVTLPDSETVAFPATQTYRDGTVVRWDQPTTPGAAEPDHPAPTLTLTGAGSSDDETATAAPQATLGADNVARALAGGALLLAAIGVGVAFVRRGA